MRFETNLAPDDPAAIKRNTDGTAALHAMLEDCGICKDVRKFTKANANSFVDSGDTRLQELNERRVVVDQLLTAHAEKNDPVTTLDGQGRLTSVVRTDGSRSEFTYNGDKLVKLKSTDARNAVSEWTPEAPKEWEVKKGTPITRWQSEQQTDETRINLKIDPTGLVSWEDVPGNVITKATDGTTTRLNINNSVTRLDSSDRVIFLRKDNNEDIFASYRKNKLSQIEIHNGAMVEKWNLDAKGEWTSPGSTVVRSRYNITEDGIESFVARDKGNVTHISYPDGTSRSFEYTNGQLSKVSELPRNTVWQLDSKTGKWQSNSVSETRSAARVSSQGEYSYVDEHGYKKTFKFDGTEDYYKNLQGAPKKAIHDAQRQLFATADGRIHDLNHRKQFKNDIEEFQRRADSAGVSPDRVVKTMHELDSLLRYRKHSFLSHENREKLALEVAYHVAMPRTIDQSKFDTCGAATAEVVTASKYPDRFANLIRQIADRGNYVSAQNQLIRPLKNSLLADTDSQNFKTHDNSGERSYASQLFQTVGIDAALPAKNFYLSDEDGERVVSDRGKVISKDFPGLEDDQVAKMLRTITGKSETVYSHGQQFKTVDEFRRVMNEVDQKKQFPVILSVDTLARGGPFYGQYRDDRRGVDSGGHYVTVWDVDKQGYVLVDDQFGREYDHESLRRLPLKTLYEGTKLNGTTDGAPESADPLIRNVPQDLIVPK